jgi:hypothetical protein
MGTPFPPSRRPTAVAEERLPRWGRAPRSWGANQAIRRSRKEHGLANVVEKGLETPVAASFPRYRDHNLNGNLRARAHALMH